MSLTYSDFPYYLDSSGPANMLASFASSSSGGVPMEFGVLEETTVPLLQAADKAYHDFIIIAEFSEVDGPIPICTIPLDAPQHIDIDVNKLAVHLMSTDYQVNTVGHFKVCEDTQVMRTNVFNNVHVFMQYFTLYDLKARGFVRPFCFGYVCKDHIKIDNNISKFANEFDKITNILKLTNRQWFSLELEAYLAKLQLAKDNYIRNEQRIKTDDSAAADNVFDTEGISLNQIAHQYTETEAILRMVNITADPGKESAVEMLYHLIRHLNPRCPLKTVLKDLFIKHSVDEIDAYDVSADVQSVPLVHPLKNKGESLRPLTTLGQIGTVNLAWKLMIIELQKRPDFMFSEISASTRSFKRHCKAYEESHISPETQGSMDSERTVTESSEFKFRHVSSVGEMSDFDEDLEECEHEHFEFLESVLICEILQKIHSAVPIIPETKYGSFNSLSEDSDMPHSRHASGNDTSSINSGGGSVSVESRKQCGAGAGDTDDARKADTSLNTSDTDKSEGYVVVASEEPIAQAQPKVDDVANLPGEGDDQGIEFAVEMRSSISSISSAEEDICSTDPIVLRDGTAELVEKIPWYSAVSKLGGKGSASGRLVKFFNRFANEAHHVLFSIMIGRPVIICGSERYKNRIRHALNALIPLVPCFPEKSWKLLRWHQGILVPAHFKQNSFKLIGLCIPEKLEVHDLVSCRCEVTTLNYETKLLQGPAYSGAFFSNFAQSCQRKFQDDVSLLSYIGSIFTEIESKIFLYKTLLDEKVKHTEILSKLDLKQSDAVIVKHFVTLIHDVENIVEVF